MGPTAIARALSTPRRALRHFSRTLWHDDARLWHEKKHPLSSLAAAYFRGAEQLAPAPLFDDPTVDAAFATVSDAEALKLSSQLAAHPLSTQLHDLYATQTRVLDRWLEEPTWPPPETTRKQIVMVGDQLCGRSHRLGIGRATTIFHVGDAALPALSEARRSEARRSDAALPALLDQKHAELKRRGVGRRCDVVAAVVGDGSAAAALERAGLDADVPTKWVFAMGALQADSPRSAANSFAMAAALGGAPGSAIAAVCIEPAFAALLGADAPQYPTEVRPAEEVLADARAAGWYNTRLLGPDAIAERCAGRRPPDGVRVLFADAYLS